MTQPPDSFNAQLDTVATAPCCEPECCDDAVEPAPASDLKTVVRAKYAKIATQGGSCCGDDADDVSMIGDAYDDVEGYLAEADLHLGCGLPTEFANLRPGQTVLDLGSGAGLDAFVARQIVGAAGRVVGVDMTPEMIEKARVNAAILGYDNVDFLLGDIEALPLDEASVDVVISNCVLNLVPDKDAAFAEMYRVLRPGGHFCVSDIVHQGTMPEAVKRSAELYAGCVAGAMEREAYLDRLRTAGFRDVRVVTEHVVDVPNEALRRSDAALLSVTVVGVKGGA
jgi:arsenite methyltransferase